MDKPYVSRRENRPYSLPAIRALTFRVFESRCVTENWDYERR